VKLGNADRLCPAFVLQAKQYFPTVDIQITVRRGPVNEVEIDVLDAELVEAGVEGAQSRVGALVRAEQLRVTKTSSRARPLARKALLLRIRFGRLGRCRWSDSRFSGRGVPALQRRHWRPAKGRIQAGEWPGRGKAGYRVELSLGETTSTDQSRSTAAR